MVKFIKQTFIVLVLGLLGFGGSLATKCVSMNNQSCMKRPMLIDLYSDELHYYPFHSLDNCDGSCHTVEDQFGRTCVPNKKEHENLKVSNMIKRINKKSLVKIFYVNADVNLMVENVIQNKI